MAFNINAQVILSQPKNLNNVSNQISKQLGQAANIKIKIGNAQQLTNLTKQLTTLNNSFTKLNSNIVSIGKAQNNFNSQLNKTNSSLKTQGGLLSNLAGRFGSVAKQAIAFGLISRPIYDLQRALTQSVKSAVEFQKEIVKISQVTGNTTSQLAGLTKQIGKLSTELGINANELAETARVISQAGIRGKELERVLTALARSTLAPTFGKITDTTEGLIAAFGQFGLKGKDAEAILGSLNKVSKEFAVEAEDLISVVRRTGGVFAQAAGDTKGTIGALQELTAIFTAVRSTTRESADTIAAGLRTIFSRIQRGRTIEFLKQFNIDLTDAKGNFVGIFPAFDQLSKRLDTLIKQGDALTLSAIAEELGGIRQIGKLLPAIAQFDKARKALQEAQKGAIEGLGIDVAKGLDTIDNRVKRVRESFKQLIRTVFESDAFQNFTKNILSSANSFLEFANTIAGAIEPILPILTALGAFKIGKGLGGLIKGGVGGAVASATGSTATAQATQKTAAATVSQNNLITNTNTILTSIQKQLVTLTNNNNSGFQKVVTAVSTKSTVAPIGGFTGRRKASGGKILGFNRGGIVPGTGNSDTVPAMLQPGEFVIKKSSVNSLGAGTLQAMNENRFQKAGPVRKTNLQKLQGGEEISLAPGKIGVFKQALLKRSGDTDGDAELDIGGAFLKPSGVINNLRGTIVGNEILAEVIKDIGGTQAQARSLLTKSTRSSKNLKIPINIQSGSFTTRKAARFRSGFRKAAAKFGADFNKREIGLPYSMSKFKSSYNVSNKEQIEGGIFESFLNAISNKPFDNAKINPNDTFDFKQGLGTAAKVFGLPGDLTADAKRTFDTDSLASLVKKGGNLLIQNITRDLATQLLAVGAKGDQPQIAARRAVLSQKAAGGSISRQDTVPALLTPGEFVFNKKSASRIGYGTLNTMNKKGITGFNKGGTVGGIQKFGNGGRPTGEGLGLSTKGAFGGILASTVAVEQAFKKIGIQGATLATALKSVEKSFADGVSDAMAFDKALDEIIKSSREAKEAEKQRADEIAKSQAKSKAESEKRQKRAPGDTVVRDTEKFASAGSIATQISNKEATNLGTQARAGKGNLVGLQKAQTQEIQAIYKKIRAEDASISMIDAKKRAEGVVRTRYGVLAREIDESTKVENELQAAKRKNISATNNNTKVNNTPPPPGGGGKGGKGGRFAGAGSNALGAAFALQALTSSVVDADSGIGKFANGLTNVLFTLTAFQGILPSPSTLKGIVGKSGFGLKGGLPGGGLLPSTGAASGLGAGGVATAAALPLVAGLAGGGIGRFLGGVIADKELGKQQSVGTIKGDTSVAAAQQRKGLGFGGAVLGGAAAGAAIGSFIPVIGTALGGVIGAGAGAIIGALTTPLDAAAQQAAFEAAKSLQEGGKAVGKSLKALEKEFNVRTFSKFSDEFAKQSDNISSKLPQIAENLDKASLFTNRAGGFKEAAKNLSQFLKPEDLQAARDQLNNNLGKVFDSLDQFDLNRIIDTGGPKDLNAAFKQAAADGNKLAEAFIKLERETTAQEITAKGAAILQDDNGDQVLGRSLVSLAGTFDFVTGSAADLNRQIDTLIKTEGLSTESGEILRGQIQEEFNTRKAAAEEQKRAAAVQANFNKALKESETSLNNFASNLKVITSGLALSLSQTSQNLDTLAKRIQSIASGSGDTVLNRQKDPNAVLRQIESFSGQDLGDVKKLRESQEKLPDILGRAVQNAGGKGASQPAVVDSVISQFAQETGLSLSGAAAEGIRQSLTALITKRQTGGTGTPIQAGAALLEAAGTQDIEELFKIFGIGAEAIKSASDELIQAYEQQINIFEQRTSIELDRLRRAQKFEQDILSRRISNEKVISSILGKSSSGVEDSVSTLKRQISGLAGTTDINAILQQKAEAQARKSQIEALAESGQLTDENSKLLAALGSQIERADQAVKLFANDTSIAASLQEKANQAKARGDVATGALDELIGAGISGDPEAIKGILSQQQSLDRVISGTGSLQDAIKVFQSQNSPIVKAIAEQRLGEGGLDSLINNLRGQLAGQLSGGPLGGLADQLLNVVKSENQQLIDLAADANILANQQLAALNNMQAQNETLIAQQTANLGGAGGPSDQQVFSDAVASFQNAVNGLDVIINRGGGAPLGRAAGGVIHRNQGGVSDGALVGAFTSRFSQGTDTIPAMLSPGEYVVRASAVRNVGVGTLDAINQGANIATARTGGPIYAYQGTYVPAGQVDRVQRSRQSEDEKKRLEDQKQKLIKAGYTGAALVNIKPPYYIAAQELNKWQKVADANAARGIREKEAQEQRKLTQARETATQLADFNVKRLLPVAKNFPIAYRAKLKQGDKFFNEFLQLRSTLKGNYENADGVNLNDFSSKNYGKTFAEAFPSTPKELFEAFFKGQFGGRYQGYAFNNKTNVPLLYETLKRTTVDRSIFPNNATSLRNDLIQYFFDAGLGKDLQQYIPYDKLLDSPLVSRSSNYLNDIFITSNLDTLREFDSKYRGLRNAQGKFKKPEEKLEGGIFAAARGEGAAPEAEPDPDALTAKEEEQLAFEQKRAKFFTTPNRRLKQLDTSIASLQQRLAEIRQKSQDNPKNARLKEIASGLQFRISRLNFFRQKISQQLERGAGFDLKNDPLLQVLTPEENQFREQYNNLVGSGLATNSAADFDKAEKLLQDFLAQNTPNSRALAERIRFEKFRLFGNANASRPQKFHSGGFVGGFAKGGEVPIIAQEGEYVMSRKAVNKVGRGTMEAINKYHNGGIVYSQAGGSVNAPASSSATIAGLQASQQVGMIANQLGSLNRNTVSGSNSTLGYLSSIDRSNSDILTVNKQQLSAFATVNKEALNTFHSGGMVGGYNRGGGVPIMAQTGEFVMRRQAVQNIGASNLQNMNRNGSISLNSSGASQELNDALTRGGKDISDMWTQMFNTFASSLESAVASLGTMPEQITTRVEPISIEGANGFAQSIADQLMPKLQTYIQSLLPQQGSQPIQPGKDL